jgi:hypothetical protein
MSYVSRGLVRCVREVEIVFRRKAVQEMDWGRLMLG